MEISEIFFFYNGAMTDSGENLVLYFLNKFAYDVSKRKSIEETGVGNGNSIHFLVVGVLFPCKKLSVAALLAYFFSRPPRKISLPFYHFESFRSQFVAMSGEWRRSAHSTSGLRISQD